jgi:hypothetical protein
MQRGPVPDATDPIIQRLAQQQAEPSIEPVLAPDPVRLAPQPPYFQEPAREDPTPVRNDLSPFAAETPDWLAERLREDAALRDSAQWSSLWKRRLVTWSLAAVLLALLAAGGVWVYQETQVEGALSVVANTTPATPLPANPPTPPDGAGARVEPVAAPGVPVTASLPAPAAEVPAKPTKPEPASLDATATEAAAADPRTVKSITIPPAAVPDLDAPVKRNARRERERAATKPHRTVASVQPKAPVEPTARQRREETLLQCRAHGYDERQCTRRSCVMTRFGLACKG